MIRTMTIAAVSLFGWHTAACAFDVTACDETVPAGEIGVLQADLSCSTTSGVGVRLAPGATLRLNGHTVTGGGVGILGEGNGRYRVQGPGEVGGASLSCVSLGAPVGEAPRIRAQISDLRVAGCGSHGIAVNGKVRLDRVSVDDNDAHQEASGVFAEKIDIRDATLERNRVAIRAWSGAKLLRTTVRDSTGTAVLAANGSVRGTDVTVVDNAGPGIVAGLAPWVNGRALLKRALVVGNDAATSNRDIVSAQKPAVRDSECGHSVKYSPDGEVTIGTWYVCAGDL